MKHFSDIVTILGSGTCVPSLRRSSSAALISSGGFHLLIDIGAGTIRRLLEAHKTIFDIDVILLTHFHPDHTGELISFLFSSKYPDLRQRTKPLTLVGGAGLAAFFDGLRQAYGHWIELEPDIFRLMELSNRRSDSRSFEAATIRSIPVAHNPESLAYRIELPAGQTIVISGDTGFSPNLIQLARRADLFICEAALPDDYKVEGHLTPSEAGRIATEAAVQHLVLTHFYPECDITDVGGQCRQTYGGPLTLAEDLLVFELPISAGHSRVP